MFHLSPRLCISGALGNEGFRQCSERGEGGQILLGVQARVDMNSFKQEIKALVTRGRLSLQVSFAVVEITKLRNVFGNGSQIHFKYYLNMKEEDNFLRHRGHRYITSDQVN